MTSNPYDDVPYETRPVTWTAPERLSLASRLHGGPRTRLGGYRVLEIGCGEGNNILPLAFYRRHASFVGLDNARSPLARARSAATELGLSNLALHEVPLEEARRVVDGSFDYIIAHGVFSWVSEPTAEALLDLAGTCLAADGLLYLDYNCRPGWDIRGMVREFLRDQTAKTPGLRARADQARELSAGMASMFGQVEFPYARLMANEFALVRDGRPGYVAHEYLAPINRAYWRSEFLQLARRHGFDDVADADFDRDSGRPPDGVHEWLRDEGLDAGSMEDAFDLVCYRQHHCPILSRAPLERQALSTNEFGALGIAACLEPVATDAHGTRMRHPDGVEATVFKPALLSAFDQLRSQWPEALGVGELFDVVADVEPDLRLLHGSGLVELRCRPAGQSPAGENALHRLESRDGDYVTSVFHTTQKT